MRTRLILPALCAALLAGCGSSAPSSTSSTAPSTLTGSGVTPRSFRGFAVELPSSWTQIAAAGTRLYAARSGAATIAIFRYPRSGKAPYAHSLLKSDLHALVALTRSRHPGFRLLHARVTKVSRRGALELVAVEQLGGRTVQVRSTHVFLKGAEIVIDEYTDPAQFSGVDHADFLPVVYSFTAEAGG